MDCRCSRSPILLDYYQNYLVSANISDFEQNVSRHYTVGTLERLVSHAEATVRRAAVLALGLLGNFSSNSLLATALTDRDRTVALLAESALRNIWRRDGDAEDQLALQNLIRMNAEGNPLKTVTYASLQLEKTPDFAEIWFQRASAWFSLGEFEFALEDLEKTLDLNPFHFSAYIMLGYVQMELGHVKLSLHAFRNALDINPGLKSSRALRKMPHSTNPTGF